jgi:sugar lactone lactonase YvrE
MMSAALLACGGAKDTTEKSAPAAAQAAPAVPVAKPVTAGWTTTDGIKTPESVYYDAVSGYIFSSQIDGAPDGRDGNGRIVKLNGDGSLVNASFTTGLNAPKGLRVCNGTLWAADLDEVIAIDVSTGAIRNRTKIADAKFLNDTTCAGDTAYVTDMFGNKIYAVTNGAATVVADGDLEFPNGLLVDGDKLIVGGWGSMPKADFSTDVPGHLFIYDMKTKKKTLITPKPTANIDGLESDGKGGYLATDYVAGKLYHILPTGEVKLLRQLKPGAADISFLPDRGILLVPQMNENQIVSYDISADLK